uniref:30S ribosomal protein S16 n=1 Tax=Fluviicola sp. TaxID=1917219 RepID=UPI00404AB190
MATRIRLQRHGKKGNAIFHLVVADSRVKRDGKFIEKLGTYNPNTNPATININFESTLKWVGTGAEMTETARAILSYKGVLFKNHLLKGVTKGALTAEQVEAKFAAWEADKANKIQGKIDGLDKSADADKAARLKAEADANAAKAKAIEAKNTPEVEEAPAEEVVAEEAPAAEEEVVATEKAPVTEEAATEAPAEEAASEETEAEA